MKKLFTLVALLACFLGAKAELKTDYKIDYSTYTGFPFYVMGYVPEWVDGVMTDYGSDYRYATQADLDGDGDGKWKDGESSVGTVQTSNGTEYQKVTGANPYWHQYFIADGINTGDMADVYTVKAWVKASEPVTINVNMGWGWGSGEQASASVSIGTDWQEVEWEYTGIGGASCNLVAQPGTSTAVIEWKSLTVTHDQTETRPTEWIELISNGDASKSWQELGLADVAYTDPENSYKVCAWGKVNAGDPFPATIENNTFVVHATDCADPTADASAWDNQFWIMSTKELKVGMKYKVHFKYKASQPAKTNTQQHSIQPSDYLMWVAIGDVTFSTDWQEWDSEWTVQEPQNKKPIYSIAFNLNAEVKTATDFYFDDLSIQEMKLDEGYFVAAANTKTGLTYDFANATEFTNDAAAGCLTATVGKKNAYINEVMISTVRGDNAAFKANTLKPNGTIENDPDAWLDYAAQSNSKLSLPGEGIWKIYLDDGYGAMAFEMIEGTAIEPLDIKPNPTLVTVNAPERDWRGTDNDGNPIEEQVGEGQPWDSQFWIKANRTLSSGEVTVVQFKYKAAKPATVSTQCHGEPGGYLHWGAIGNVDFTEDWKDFETTFTVPGEADGMQSIAFNMSELKDANTYELKDFVWKLENNMETLIDQTGEANFFKKEGAGTAIVGTGIINVVNSNKNTKAAIYNLAGQRVSNDYKGIVVKEGKKVVLK